VILVATLLAAALAVFFVLSRAGWPGAPSVCLRNFVCYCERTTWDGPARQPWNTWSSLTCAPVALLIAVDAARLRTSDGPDTASRRRAGALGVLYALAVVMEGIGSLYFHGSLTTWGAVLDAAGIVTIGSLVLLVTLLRGSVLDLRGVLRGWPVILAMGLFYRMFVPVMAPLFLVLLVGIVLAERHARRAASTPAERAWFTRMMALFGVGVVALVLSALPGFPLCSGRLVQGHALWHLLCALASGACWMHARAAVAERAG
jgi:hypothetical protein